MHKPWFRLLGEVRVLRHDEPVAIGHRRLRCLLAALLVDVGRVVPLDTLVDRMWREQVPGRPRETLYTYLSRLWTVLSGVTRSLFRLRRSLTLATDVPERAYSHIALARAYARAGDDERALAHAADALELYLELDARAWEATALNEIGVISARVGKHDEADTLDRLAERHLALGDHARAEARWREASALYQAQFRDADDDRVRRRLGSFGS